MSPEAIPSQRSKREEHREVYDAFKDASPGDLLFFISDSQTNHAELPKPPTLLASLASYQADYYKNLFFGDSSFTSSAVDSAKKNLLPYCSKYYKDRLGIVYGDDSLWHTAIYAGKKRGRPYIFQASRGKGVTFEHLLPSYFRSERDPEQGVQRRHRIEVLATDGITEADRAKILEYCKSQVGKEFNEENGGWGWRYDYLTYLLGLPSKILNPDKVSCHGLAYKAYGEIGFEFPHQIKPSLFNVARYLGHPLGHPVDHVDLERLYLRDHHLYEDARFRVVFAAFDDPETGQPITEINPEKYSWLRS